MKMLGVPSVSIPGSDPSRYQRHQIPQNSNLHNADDGTTLVAGKFGVVAGHRYNNAAAAIRSGVAECEMIGKTF